MKVLLNISLFARIDEILSVIANCKTFVAPLNKYVHYVRNVIVNVIALSRSKMPTNFTYFCYFSFSKKMQTNV